MGKLIIGNPDATGTCTLTYESVGARGDTVRTTGMVRKGQLMSEALAPLLLQHEENLTQQFQTVLSQYSAYTRIRGEEEDDGS